MVESPSRNSQLNRTMVISKRGERPGLPQINDDDPCLSEPICAPSNLEIQQRVNFRPGKAKSRVFVDSSQPPKHASRTDLIVDNFALSESETMQEFQRAFEEIEQTQMTDNDKLCELRRRILSLVDTTEKQWNAHNKPNDENLCVGQTLENEITKRAAIYADQFFKICERNGIDVEKVLKEDPDTIFNMKLRSALPTPSTADEQIKEIEALRKERDYLNDEAKSLKSSYSSLFKSYEKLRSNYELLHASRNMMSETVEKQKNAMNIIYESALNFKSIMLDRTMAADQTIAEIKGKYDSSTVTIRMDLVKLENENSSLKSEIEFKKREVDELRDIIKEIANQVTLESV